MYKFREGFPAPKGVSAEKVAADLEKARAESGRLTAKSIVEYAQSNPGTDLSLCFEWDDSVAAERYREKQASTLARAIIIVDISEEKERPALVLTVSENVRQYVPAEIAMQDSNMAKIAINRAKGLVSAAQSALDTLLEMRAELTPGQKKSIQAAKKHMDKAARAAAGI